ncbi:spore germination protein [Bacillus xiapuensis]|uniref:Spore germination protein n=1 Tax=Bacillus xiapuensis TaxID=2014075 RepID=A0ABU6NBR9_9BACI|nr:spore germination protein [Bacillus xiapuensis]
MKIIKKSEINLSVLEDWFKNAFDVEQTTKYFDGKKKTYSLELFYCPYLVELNVINDIIIPKIREETSENGEINFERITNLVGATSLKKDKDIKFQIEQKLFSGELVIYDNDSNQIYFIIACNLPKRGPEESNTETSVRGPRDGLVENISDNMALIRQRLKTTSFKNIEYSIGARSKTKVILLYMDDIINPSILSEVQKRLESFDIDILSSSVQLEEMLYDYPYSIFPLMDYIGRPDYVVESLNQGRFAILVDGNPSCIIGPTNVIQLMFTPEDLNNSFFYISFVRILRVLAFVTTIFLPGFYVAVTAFHPEEIPFTLLATIFTSRVGLPMSGTMEVFVMITLFELFKEAGLRLPKAVGQTVAVLGGLIIGDAAIRAGLTSPSMLVIISLTVISGYTLINQNLAGNLVILRYFVLTLSSFLGLYGFFISIFVIGLFVVSLESFGQPYLSVFTLPTLSDLSRQFIRLPYKLLKKRNHYYNVKDTTRQKE